MKSEKSAGGPEPSSDPMFEVFDLIGAIARRMDRLQALALSRTNLTAPQYMILANLHEKDGRPLGELADIMRCSKSTITGVVDTMERKGLVARVPNPEDRRSHLVRITPKGKALRKSSPELESFFESCGPCLDVKEFERLRESLARLDRAMSELVVAA